MEAVHLDTHVAVWIFTGGRATELLSKRARGAIDGASAIFVSPAVMLELALLRESGKIVSTAQEYLIALRESIGLELADHAFSEVADEATRLAWTRDPFDRLIAAQARVAGTRLVTRDRTIRAHLDLALW
jgi:PIN domain nuclease of toxin-antitoxin system